MQFITNVEIVNFRSVRHLELTLSDFTALAGANNSGKSNVLAALYLYFTNATAPGHPLSFADDYPRSVAKAKRKKQSRVSVTFELPLRFRYRRGLEETEALLGRTFRLTKIWKSARIAPEIRLVRDGAEKSLSDAEGERAQQFLDLIELRRIPNRVLPLDVLREQQKNLNALIASRVGTTGTTVFEKLHKVADGTSKSIDAPLRGASRSVERVRLVAPTSVKELALALSYSVAQGDLTLADEQQGSGIQSFLMFAALLAIDRAVIGTTFGWKQMVLWLVEEPESSLHMDLEARLAATLREANLAKEGRHQTICTTHSQVIVENATQCYLLESLGPTDRNGTTARVLPEQERVDVLATAGIGSYVHPLLRHPLSPICVVEGDTDKLIMGRAWAFLHPGIRLKFVTVAELTGKGGGVAALREYLRHTDQHLKVRSPRAPVLLLIDWDEKDLKDLEKSAQLHSTSAVLRFAETDANTELDSQIRGIERYLPTALLKKHETELATGAMFLVPKTSKYRYAKSDVDGTHFKSKVAADFAASATPADCSFVAPMCGHLASAIKKAQTP